MRATTEHPFTVVGILERTGTPVDQAVHVPLEGITAIHIGWESGTRLPGRTVPAERLAELDLTPASVTAVLVGVRSRLAVFALQRELNERPGEPLLAILPGVALAAAVEPGRGGGERAARGQRLRRPRRAARDAGQPARDAARAAA
ncbi:MAG: hypothetical protein RML12_05600 [Xanthomonadales bacterium]|nr:hypothetical protein [Xanthomonadales bacterium]